MKGKWNSVPLGTSRRLCKMCLRVMPSKGEEVKVFNLHPSHSGCVGWGLFSGASLLQQGWYAPDASSAASQCVGRATKAPRGQTGESFSHSFIFISNPRYLLCTRY